jgi:predicted ribosome quality control (RQC) complex YloA/Tae2 family protein
VHQQLIKAVVEELSEVVAGRTLGVTYQVSPFTLVFDFRLREGDYLLVSADPRRPRIHLVRRKTRALEKSSLPPGSFAQYVRSTLRGAKVLAFVPVENERVVRIAFSKDRETGATENFTILAQLTGRSANLFVLDANNVILQALRPPRGEHQQIGQDYQPPPQQARAVEEPLVKKGHFPTLSAALDAHFAQIEAEEQFDNTLQRARARWRQRLGQAERLRANLLQDLELHGDAEEHKQLGDLLLANMATAERVGSKVRIKDYFSEGEPFIELEVEESRTLAEEANACFAKYARSKRAHEEGAKRLTQVTDDLERLKAQEALFERAAATRDLHLLEGLGQKEQPVRNRTRKEKRENLPGVRRYRSSDGFEILVGRAAHVNDRLTFKVAKPHDLWLHAADYPGSHVVVRNPGRKDVPHRSIVEAAQLAAKFSQASGDAKVNVNYTQRKFLSKPKGAQPGLVRMSSFKTIIVAPSENIERD